MTMLGKLMIIITITPLAWWKVIIPLFCIIGIWIGRELLMASFAYFSKKSRIKSRRKAGLTNG